MSQRSNHAEQSPKLLKEFTEFLTVALKSVIEEPSAIWLPPVQYSSADAKFGLHRAELS